ncbi:MULTISPECIES: hypothetical protein [unclassified Mesorhizobium]|uniref:hypothetical protein n=1 Tax=unclassified Mesorhizobium TaxID=325217 RepID=UPI0012EB7821|nr:MULTISPECIES: hypothetical protein [unclassified Mesorhizobium]WJI77883.1 hypothetical protein NLY37_14755 [Mesorhizobium sp. C395A]
MAYRTASKSTVTSSVDPVVDRPSYESYAGTLASEAVVGVYSPAQGFMPTLQVEERQGCPFQALGKWAKIILPIVAANQDVVGHLAEKVHPEIVKPSGASRS